jgi:cytoskeletal protein CcmA (bactofilin family)
MAIFNKGDTMAKNTDATTIISVGSKIIGEMELTSKLHIEGEIEGKIVSSNLVSIGKTGLVKGELKANKLLVDGIFEGKVEVELLEITKSGKVMGEIIIKDLIIEQGGVFEGTSTLKRKDASKNS